MNKSEKELKDDALARQKESEGEQAIPLDSLEDMETPIYELLKAREVPRKWKAY